MEDLIDMDLRELCQKAKEANWSEEFWAGQLNTCFNMSDDEFETLTVKELMLTYYRETLARKVAERMQLESFIEVFASLDDEADGVVEVLEVDIYER